MAPGESLSGRAAAGSRPAEQGGVGEREEALRLLADRRRWGELLRRAQALCREHFGRKVFLCSIIALRRGGCGEDCAFCAQSARYPTGVKPQPMMSPGEVLRAAEEAAERGATHFGLVTSGRTLSEADFQAVLRLVRLVSERVGLRVCASLGALDEARARALVEAGCVRYNHNLETSPRHFPRLCTTHRYTDRLATVEAARRAGLEVCCGGIIGTGEDLVDRVELAFALRRLAPEVIPINVLVPIPGTPLARMKPMDREEVLATVALFRLVNPRSIIKLAGGREYALGEEQERLFQAGANALILGNYLTTVGRPAEEDLEMIGRLGLVPAGVGEGQVGGVNRVRA